MASGMVEVNAPPACPEPARAPRLPRWTPYLLAVLFALLSLRNLGDHSIVETDAARHAMNGAFVHDLVRSGRVAHPVAYGKEYYGRLPALSMPYHPPVFPVIEALFYFIFGVNLLAARLAVAVAVGACAVLLYRLVETTQRSTLLALCVTVTTLSLAHSQLVAMDVMLEYPALAFSLAALYCLCGTGRGYPLGRALLFAALGATAVWTKQFAVFLLAVPPLYFLATRRWRLLFTRSFWISSALFALAVKALAALSTPFNRTGVDAVPLAPESIWWVINHNALYYGQAALHELFGWPGLFALCVAVLLIPLVRRGAWKSLHIELYLAWIVAIVAVLMVVGSSSARYLFFVFPPVLVAAYCVVLRGSQSLLGPRRAWIVPAVLAAVWLVAGLRYQPEFLRGPAGAARVVARSAPQRVLYAGDADGNFIFAVRELDPKLQDTVIPAEKMPAEIYPAGAFEDFCRRYAIDWVVLEDTVTPAPWSDLIARPTPSMRLERTLPLESSRTRWMKGSIHIYRFTSPAARPEGGLSLPIERIQGAVEVRR
jgi:4-amino-4-deoxy-L-arabinose transferase-like glycosyltransferase